MQPMKALVLFFKKQITKVKQFLSHSEKHQRLIKKGKALWRLFLIRRENGQPLPTNQPEPTNCLNCGQTFTGNYCNVCGQSRKTTKYTVHSIFQNILGGMTNIDHGFGYTLIELLIRPGYMINDYIAGKRVRYFRPFQSLFVLAAIYILFVQVIDPNAIAKEERDAKARRSTYAEISQEIKEALNEESPNSLHSTSGQKAGEKLTQKATLLTDSLTQMAQDQAKQASLKNKSQEKAAIQEQEEENNYLFESPFLRSVEQLLTKWAHGNKAASILCTIPIFALATRSSFRKRSSSKHFNITEHIFIQTYIACLILLVSIIYLPFNGKADINSLYDIPYWGIFGLYFYAYKQLFEIGWWKSMRKTLQMFFYALFILIGLAIIVGLLFFLISAIDHLFAK